MNAHHRKQWWLWRAGLVLHGFSATRKKMAADPDTAPDLADNIGLDRKDADGRPSDGMEDGWLRVDEPGELGHDLKNIPREQFEILHPKTIARIVGRELLLTHLFYLGLGAAIASGGALWWWLR